MDNGENAYVVISDEEGNEYKLEHLDTFEFEGAVYLAFVPADEEEPEEMILFRQAEEDGEEYLETIDDEEELERVYQHFMEELFEDEDE